MTPRPVEEDACLGTEVVRVSDEVGAAIKSPAASSDHGEGLRPVMGRRDSIRAGDDLSTPVVRYVARGERNMTLRTGQQAAFT